MARAWRRIDGVLPLDKPAGMTSNAALQAARRIYYAEKAGHGGTLDPLASGMLPILFGQATRFSAWLLDADKTYLANVQLGVTTQTADAEGAVLESRAVQLESQQIDEALAGFRGEIQQVPPMYSALKRNGRPLYLWDIKPADLESWEITTGFHCLACTAGCGSSCTGALAG